MKAIPVAPPRTKYAFVLRPSWRSAERIFEMSPALLAVAGFDGYLRRFNPAFEVFGYSREELLSRPWIEFAHPDDREQMLEDSASLERGAHHVELENRVICRDGSLRRVEWSTRVVPEEGLLRGERLSAVGQLSSRATSRRSAVDHQVESNMRGGSTGGISRTVGRQ